MYQHTSISCSSRSFPWLSEKIAKYQVLGIFSEVKKDPFYAYWVYLLFIYFKYWYTSYGVADNILVKYLKLYINVYKYLITCQQPLSKQKHAVYHSRACLCGNICYFHHILMTVWWEMKIQSWLNTRKCRMSNHK